MNDHDDESQEFCHRHPKQALVGICPFCLNEKLLAVAAIQRHRNHFLESFPRTSHSRKPSNVGLPKIIPFGSVLNRIELFHRRHRRGTYDFDGDAVSDTQRTSTSLEDSFISMKFEENGIGLWEKSEVSKVYNPCDAPTTSSNKSVVEHMKSPRGSMRWRKRIGHLFQLIRWKRTNKSYVNGVKVRNRNWIRSLTSRRTCKK